jgi:hypothetical protein
MWVQSDWEGHYYHATAATPGSFPGGGQCQLPFFDQCVFFHGDFFLFVLVLRHRALFV